MSTREPGEQKPEIASREELVGWFEAGCKPREDWRIGTEHEKFPFYTDDLSPVPYGGDRGIRALLETMAERFGWDPILEGETIIGLKREGNPGAGNISLEPGGQFELSGAPLETVHDTCGEVDEHLRQARAVGEELGIGFLGLGFSPKWTLVETPLMPKGRYKIMKSYMPKVGSQGLDMMFRTCTIQVNLDFGGEPDMVDKFRLSLALQPLATALFANSPFTEGRPNGLKSLRSEIWKDVDTDRTGMLPFVFEDGFGFERYVDYALDVPMYFVYRDGRYIDASGQSFRDFLDGKLAGLPGEKPTIDDWSDHLTTIFPEVRLKRFLEMRGADGGPWKRICALPAFWVGLLYDADAQSSALDLVKDWSAEQRQQLRDDVPKQGLAAEIAGRSLQDVGRDVLEIARSGLEKRARSDSLASDETHFLSSLLACIETGQTPADQLLTEYQSEWDAQIDPIFVKHAF